MRALERWPTVRPPSWKARRAYLAVTAAVLAPALALMAACGLGVLPMLALTPFAVAVAWATARDDARALPPWGYALGTLGAALSASVVAAWLGVSFEVGAVAATVALVGGSAGATLARAVNLWRRQCSPRRALDAWAGIALLAAGCACAAALGAGVVATLLHVLLVVEAVALTAAVLAVEVVAMRRVERLYSGEVEGLAVTDASGESWGDVSETVSWRMTSRDRLVPVTTVAYESGYRAPATLPVVALIPQTEHRSWRLVCLPIAAVCALLTLLRR